MNLPLFPSHPECRSCARWEQAPLNPGVPTTQWGLPGAGVPVLIVIAPTPGYHEHMHNTPFMGKPGQLLRNIILDELSTLCTIYGTYLARCGPNLDAKARDFKACFSFHLSDLSAIFHHHPTQQIHILLLGSDATTQFHRLHLGIRLPLKAALSINGKPRTIFSRSVPVFATIHPAAVLRSHALISTIEDHIELLIATIKGCAPTPTDPDIQPARSPHH